jgi:hypothetical protein
MAAMNQVYIRCIVHRGLFDTEYYVLVNGSSAYYVGRQNVEVQKVPTGNQGVEGKVKGYLIQTKGAQSLVELPGEAALGGLRTWVESSAIAHA